MNDGVEALGLKRFESSPLQSSLWERLFCFLCKKRGTQGILDSIVLPSLSVDEDMVTWAVVLTVWVGEMHSCPRACKFELVGVLIGALFLRAR